MKEFKLGDHRYSPLERKVFAMLPQNTNPQKGIGVTSVMVAAVLFGRAVHGRQTALGALSSLRIKVIRNREPFRITKTPRKGPHPMMWAVEAKK